VVRSSGLAPWYEVAVVFAELTNVWPATVGTSTVASYVTVVDAPWFSAKEDGYVHVISVPVQLGALVVEVATTPTGSAEP